MLESTVLMCPFMCASGADATFETVHISNAPGRVVQLRIGSFQPLLESDAVAVRGMTRGLGMDTLAKVA